MIDSVRSDGNVVTIFKDGALSNIEEDRLSKNDVVVLQTGDFVPADLKLVEADGLEMDEFDITGEIMPVVKTVGETDVLLFRGSKVLKGTGMGMIVATGSQTEYGKILQLSYDPDQDLKVPLARNQLFWIAGLLLPAFVLSFLRSVSSPVFLVGAYLLLAAIFVFLLDDTFFRRQVYRIERMNLERRNVQVRGVRTIEQIGQVDTFCFDKTGVLTSREMVVRQVHFADQTLDADHLPAGEDAARLVLLASAACNDVMFYEKVEQANPVDKALIGFANKHGTDVQQLFSSARRFSEKPFHSEERYMASRLQFSENEAYFFVKGDPAVILNQCDRYLETTGKVRKADFNLWVSMNARTHNIGQMGDSPIAMAYAEGPASAAPQKFIFLCLFQLENPLAPGAREVVEKVHNEGILSYLLTGDRAETAVKIAKDSGIARQTDAVLTGPVLERMQTPDIASQSDYCSIFARLMPSQKGWLIRLLQQKGHIIAMVGDGSNDGIALKVADVGISFFNNSSLVARRLAKILIKDLSDLTVLVESAKRVRRRVRYLRLVRSSMFFSLLIGAYLWALGW